MDNKNDLEQSRKEVLFIGVGGASCSGKTTLAKALRWVLPDSVIIHQDDFAPPEHLIPMHPVLDIKDWDDPEGAIDWPRFSAFLQQVRADGRLPEDHKTHGGWSENPEKPISDATFDKWRATFTKLREAKKRQGVEVSWGLVDGFLLYWHPDAIRELDIRLFLRVPYETLKARREQRFGYHTQALVLPEGTTWIDPPGYWDDIVWPAYLKAHQRIFENGDVSRGNAVPTGDASRPKDDQHSASKLTNGTLDNDSEKTVDGHSTLRQSTSVVECGDPVPGLVVMPSSEISLEELFEKTCQHILSYHDRRND